MHKSGLKVNLVFDYLYYMNTYLNVFFNCISRLKSLLTDKIGYSAKEEHELPWHPPTCPNDKDAAAFTQKKPQK